MSDDTLIQLTADIVSAHVSNNTVPPDKIAGLIESVFAALSNRANPLAAEPVKAAPAVSIRASVKPDYIVCLEDGVKMKTVRRHIQVMHNMTPAEYRAKWDLPSDYPLVAPNYSEKRRDLSLALGLGRKKALEPIAEPEPAPPAKRGRSQEEDAERVQAPSPEVAEKPARKPRTKKSPVASSE